MWLASLALPAATITQNGGTDVFGVVVLLMGWFGLLEFQIGWLANPVLVVALPIIAFATRPWRMIMFATAAALLLCGMSALSWNDFPDDRGSNPVTSFGPGFYLWLAAVFGTAITAFAKAIMEDRPDDNTI
jgi:hypothetical protein